MSSLQAITAKRLLLPSGAVEAPLLLLSDGLIRAVTTQSQQEAPRDTLHLQDVTIAPGFYDIHVHGAGGRDVMEGSPEAIQVTGQTLARHGTTSFLATTVTAPVDHTLHALECIACAIEATAPDGVAQPIGIHLEGPFISHAKRGVHPPSEIQRPSVSLFERFRQAARGHIRLMTIAPEVEGASELISYAAAQGVRISLGHSNATAAQTRAGIARARSASSHPVSATHTFNAMRPLDHREPGILGITLDDAELYAELICDGIHTTPEAVRLWFRSKGSDRAILITDGMAATGMPDGDYKLGELDVEVRNGVCMSSGVLAGSVLTMDRAVSNLRSFTGASLETAVQLASANPKRLTGIPGADAPLQPGGPADLTIFNEQGVFAGTVVRGVHLPRL